MNLIWGKQKIVQLKDTRVLSSISTSKEMCAQLCGFSDIYTLVRQDLICRKSSNKSNYSSYITP